MKRIAKNLLLPLLFAPLAAAMASEDLKLDRAPDRHDVVSLQRGARVFVNYCQGCHSASYMRYIRLQDLGLSEKQIRENLIFTGAKRSEERRVGKECRL